MIVDNLSDTSRSFHIFFVVLKFLTGILIFITMCKYAKSHIKKQMVM